MAECRVRFTTSYGAHKKGDEVDVDEGVAASWRAAGVVRDVPRPTIPTPAETATKRKEA